MLAIVYISQLALGAGEDQQSLEVRRFGAVPSIALSKCAVVHTSAPDTIITQTMFTKGKTFVQPLFFAGHLSRAAAGAQCETRLPVVAAD